jgi:hypothetical protein
MPFRELVSEGKLYADKTPLVAKMADGFKCCFLSRPRRFGKTFLLDTAEELFSGDERLFQGLGAAASGWKFPKHPVVRLAMGYAETGSPENLKKYIIGDLRKAARADDLPLAEELPGAVLGELLAGLTRKHGAGAVLLVDEHDAPASRHIDDPARAWANAKVLHDFYGALKNNIGHLRFALVTGLTRLALASTDSGPGLFQDLSRDPQYAGICGFTMSEFDEFFADRMEGTLERLKAVGHMGPDAGRSRFEAGDP